jgi:lipopolysaccharide transport system permease protein
MTSEDPKRPPVCRELGEELQAAGEAAHPDTAIPTVEVDVERSVFRGSVLSLSGLWSYRHLFVALVVRDVKARYRHTWVGFGWAVLQPTLLMAVFTLFLGPSADPDVPYPLYVYSGFMIWTFFSTALLAAGQSVLAAERVVTKMFFPRLLLPWAAAGAILVDLVGSGAGLATLMAWYGLVPTWQVCLAPLPVVFVGLLAGGVGALFAALNVLYRDFRYLVPFLVQLWMFSTPVLFLLAPGPRTASGSGVRAVLTGVNPLNGLIGFFRAAILGGELQWGPAGAAAGVCLAAAVLGCWYYRRAEHRFADVI